MKIEHRTHRVGEMRATKTDDGMHVITLQPIVPFIPDDYGSVWMPDVFDESLDRRLPTLAWAHNWQEPIGRAIAWRAKGDLREIDFRLDDFDDVPQARRAFSQVRSGTLDDCSVGFSNTTRREPTAEERERWPGAAEIMIRSELDETSPVLRGAVPGAKVLALRSRDGRVASVAEDVVMDVARKVAAGEMTKDEGQVYLDLIATDDGTPATVLEQDPAEATSIDEALAEADAALDAITGRSR